MEKEKTLEAEIQKIEKNNVLRQGPPPDGALIIDFIYYCIYKIFLKSRLTRKDAHSPTIVFISMMIDVHALYFFLWVKAKAGLDIAHSTGKVIIVLIFVFTIILFIYFYVWKKNGEKAIKYYSGKIGEKKSVVIGYIIFFETLFSPFIVWGFIYLWQKYI